MENRWINLCFGVVFVIIAREGSRMICSLSGFFDWSDVDVNANSSVNACVKVVAADEFSIILMLSFVYSIFISYVH